MDPMKTNDLLPKDLNDCPYLFLAPMEGVGDRSFRKAVHTIGGFDEAVTEFISVPAKAHIDGLVKKYDKDELAPTPLAAQIMGADPLLMGAVAALLEEKGAHRVDINCGCPSNTVTGRGAGSSLLRNPKYLHDIAKSVVSSVSIPVTIKMRSGYEDISLFEENLLAAEESGASFITLHPRTKIEGYTPPANWDLIARAKEVLNIPVIGNGDITSVADALSMLSHTKCDALMIGRGAVINPFIFEEIKCHFAKTSPKKTLKRLQAYLLTFLEELPPHMPLKNKTSKLKQLMSFLFKANPLLAKRRQEVLRTQFQEPNLLLEYAYSILKTDFLQEKQNTLVENSQG
jgi:nifR3 family TIM-barrel protein